MKAEGDTEADKHVRKAHYAAELGGAGGGGGGGGCSIFLRPSSSSPLPSLYLCLELVKSSAGLSLQSRQACGMRVRPLKPV